MMNKSIETKKNNMDIYKSFPFQAIKKNRAIALGFFDGVHLGHQKLLRQLLTVSKKNNLTSAVFTFQNHPRNLLENTDNFDGLIQNSEMRLEIFQQFGVAETFMIPMNRDFLHISAEDFYTHYLCEKLQMKALIVGVDAHFGYRGAGDIDKLKAWTSKDNVQLHIMSDVKLNGVKVSSTYIRRLLQEGNMALANQCLGFNYKIKGNVIHGKKLGRTLGFPTINLIYAQDLIKPKFGVYMTYVVLQDKKYPAITFVGTNPTVESDNRQVKIETYIYDYNFNLYDETVSIEFLDFVRPEYHFSSIDKMKERILSDLNFVKEKHVANQR